MAVISMVGVHFGSPNCRWNPKMAKYIFTERNGIHAIDCNNRKNTPDRYADFMRDAAELTMVVLFAGTKNKLLTPLKKKNAQVNTHQPPLVMELFNNWGTISQNVLLLV